MSIINISIILRALCIAVANKSFGQLLNTSPTNYIYSLTFPSEFSYIEVWFTDQNSAQLEIEDEIDLTLVSNDKGIWLDIQSNPEINFMPKAMDFYPSHKIWTKVWAVSIEKSFWWTGKSDTHAAKTAGKQAILKTAEATVDLVENWIAEKTIKVPSKSTREVPSNPTMPTQTDEASVKSIIIPKENT